MSLSIGQRNGIIETCSRFVAHSATIDYPDDPGSIRPHVYRTVAWLAGFWHRGNHSKWDCSIAVQQVFYEVSGVKDPSGFNYEGWGDTQSWLNHLKHYDDPINAHRAALVVFGADLDNMHQHGCIVFEQGPDPLLWSHGSSRGPILIRLSEEQKFHAGTTVFLDVSPLG